MLVAVQKALLLDEVDEHQTVEHQGGVPVAVALCRESLDELLEGGQLLAEAVVEALGDALDVQRLQDLSGDVGNAEVALFFQRERDAAQPLQQGRTRLALVVTQFADGRRLAGFALDPLPDLPGLGGIHEDDQVLVVNLRHPGFDLAADALGRNGSIGVGAAAVDGKARLFRHGFERVFVAVNGQRQRLPLIVVPTQTLYEQVRKVEGL